MMALEEVFDWSSRVMNRIRIMFIVAFVIKPKIDAQRGTIQVLESAIE